MTSNCGAPPLSAPSAPAKIRRHQSPRADAAPQKQWPRLLSRRCLSACQADKGRTTSVWRLYPVTLRRATRQHVREGENRRWVMFERWNVSIISYSTVDNHSLFHCMRREHVISWIHPAFLHALDQSASYEEPLDAAAVVRMRRLARDAAVRLKTTMVDLKELSGDATTASVTPDLSISSLEEESCWAAAAAAPPPPFVRITQLR